jgi:hypothetical protein
MSCERRVAARHPSQARSLRLATSPPPHPPPVPRRPVLVDLIGCCFNCLRIAHVAPACSRVTRSLRCHGEGHQARHCKRSRSLEAAGPTPPAQQHPRCLAGPRADQDAVIILDPREGDVMLAAMRSLFAELVPLTAPVGPAGPALCTNPGRFTTTTHTAHTTTLPTTAGRSV